MKGLGLARLKNLPQRSCSSHQVGAPRGHDPCSTIKQLAQVLSGRPPHHRRTVVKGFLHVPATRRYIRDRRRHRLALRRGARRRAEGDNVGFLGPLPSDGFLKQGITVAGILSEQRPLLILGELAKACLGVWI